MESFLIGLTDGVFPNIFVTSCRGQFHEIFLTVRHAICFFFKADFPP